MVYLVSYTNGLYVIVEVLAFIPQILSRLLSSILSEYSPFHSLSVYSSPLDGAVGKNITLAGYLVPSFIEALLSVFELPPFISAVRSWTRSFVTSLLCFISTCLSWLGTTCVWTIVQAIARNERININPKSGEIKLSSNKFFPYILKVHFKKC